MREKPKTTQAKYVSIFTRGLASKSPTSKCVL